MREDELVAVGILVVLVVIGLLLQIIFKV